MYFPTVMLAVVLTCVADDVVHDVSDCHDSSPLCDRLGQLERQLTGQSRLLSEQHHLLRRLESKLSHQESQLQSQDEKLSHQEDVMHEQAEQLLYQRVLNQRQDERLSQQESLLNHQAAKLRQQERLYRQQDLKLSRRASLVQQLRAEKACDSAELKTVKERLDSVLDNNTDRDNSVSCDNDCVTHELPATPSPPDSNDSVITRDVMPRSDDQGPLEAVVGHMGQQLTELSADIQALKNADQTLQTQTDTQIQTLKTQTDTQIQALKNTNGQQDQAIQDAQSSTFIHWGSSQCSNASQLVYSGVVGGSYFSEPGAATNYLCLTTSPVPSDRGLPFARAYLYGAEYETENSNQDKDPVCSVCRSRLSNTVMIPGTNACTTGWHQHYSGFLMAGYHDHTAGSEFICVDSSFESRMGGDTDHNGKLLYFTVAQCGSLPCGPYVNNKLVTCVVCSK